MKKRIVLLASVGLAVLLLTAVVATTALAQGTTPNGQQGTPGWRGGGMTLAPALPTGGLRLRSGASAGVGGWQYGSPRSGITNTQPFGGYGGMMGGNGSGAGCAGMAGWASPTNGNPISMDQAVAAAQEYVTAYDNDDLALSEIMEFANNFYVQVQEKSTGKGAFELLVNRTTGAVFPEMGPNMMWNTKYSPMAQGGMMGMMGRMNGGWWGGQQAGPMTVTEQQARVNAQKYLDATFLGATLADDTGTFYGYYSMDFLQNGKIAGMLSVNGYTGQVWYHTWHGAFVAEKELQG